MTATAAVVLTLWLLPAMRGYAIWAGASTGNANDATHAYLTVGNWVSGTIDDSFFGFTFTGATTLYFNGDRTTGAGGLNTTYNGNYALTLQGTGADRTLTLGGNVVHQPPGGTAAVLTLGSAAAGSRLYVNLGGVNPVFWAGSGALARDINVRDGFTGTGGFVKDGLGTLDLSGTGSFSGAIQVNAGTLGLSGESALGASAGNVTVNSGATVRLAGSYTAAHSLSRTFTINGGFVSVTGGNAQFGSILAGSGITKVGAGRLQLNNNVNSFSGGLTVTAGTLLLYNANVGGQNVAGNDITANGGNVAINAAGTIGANQLFKVDTTTALSGIGVNANIDLPTFTQIGTGPGVVIVDSGAYTRADGTDTQVTALRNAGWFLGSANNGTYTGTSLAAAPGYGYRLGGGGSTLTINNGVLTGSADVTIGAWLTNGGGTVLLNAANPFTGATAILNGTLQLSGSGAILNSSGILVKPETLATCTLYNLGLANGVNNRLGDSMPIILAAGAQAAILRQAFTGSVDAQENLGPIVLRSGRASIVQGHDSGAQLSNAFIRSDADGLTRENRSIAMVTTQRNGQETTAYNNPSIGVRRDAANLNDSDAGNQIFLDSAPPTLGGGARGTAKPVVPFLQSVDNSIAGNNGIPNTLMTYNGTEGLRALRVQTDVFGNTTEYVTSVALANADGLDNVRSTAAETVNANKTVNALILTSGNTTVAANTTLTVGSGVVMFKGGTLVGSDPVTSVLQFGNQEGLLYHIDGSIITISTALAGSNGLTTFGSPTLTGKNTYSGQTTVIGGRLVVYRTTQLAANANESIPDDGLVLVHPGATFQAGSNNSAYQTQEIVGSVAGAGTIALGHITIPTASKRSALIIGQGGSGDVATVTLDGGTIAPGMTNEVDTLSVTVDQANSTPIPVALKKGTLAIDITGAGVNDRLAVTGATTVSAAGTLAIDVDVNGYTPTIGQQWTILTASSVTDGNGGKLVDTVTDNSPAVNFTASIVGGNSVVLTAVSGLPSGTVILLR